ncbi:FumA C-terminus/TtdB family hydratase beta subunit, partial [Escherichia coli]
HDIRVIRLPRHGASCPVGMGVSCSADRNIKAKINREGIWIEKLEHNPGQYIPEELRKAGEGEAVKVDLNRPMKEILAQLSQYPVSTRLSLTGTIIVGRDIAHAKLKELIDAGKELPQYIKDHPIYYAGPAKTPAGYPSGSLGPTTAGRMDSYVDLLQSHGGSMIMLAKGNRSQQVTDACHKHGGFYLGSIGGPAAVLAQQSIKHLECVAYPELGMEAIWKIEVEDFPAFILVDDKGNDFFQQIIVVPLLLATAKRYPLTPLLYTLIFFHAIILMVGGQYTYAKVPVGFEVQEWLGLSRNPYDKLGHFFQGLVPALVAREILVRG